MGRSAEGSVILQFREINQTTFGLSALVPGINEGTWARGVHLIN